MLDVKDYNELLSLEAACKIMLEQCRKLRQKAEGSFTAKQKRKGLTQEQKAKLLADREKNILRSQARILKSAAPATLK